MLATGTDRLVERVVAGVRPEQLAVAGAKAGNRAVVALEFCHRRQRQAGHGARAALGQRVEGADAVDLVAEHIDSQRRRRPGREDVDDAAARRVFAGLVDGARA